MIILLEQPELRQESTRRLPNVLESQISISLQDNLAFPPSGIKFDGIFGIKDTGPVQNPANVFKNNLTADISVP